MTTEDNKIQVLDHGYVRLFESMGNDLSIVRNARVSYDAEWRAGEDEGKDRKLIHYLLKNYHTSPFEAVTFTFEVKAPIFVFRQWHRHRTWSYNEISARYAQLPAEMYEPDYKKLGLQSTSNKQMRVVENFDDLSADEKVDRIHACNIIAEANKRAYASYEQLLGMGVPRELARGVLPVNTYSHMFATVNLNNLFKFLVLRIHPHAQYEIRVYGEAILQLIEPIVPVAVEAFKEYMLKGK
jgi:thymidylate synthase (FAD)